MNELFKFNGSPSPKAVTFAGIIGGIIMFCLWWLAAVSGAVSPKILPNPIDTILSIGTLFSENELVPNIGYTVGLNLLGYFFALVVSIPVGFAIGIFPFLRASFQKIFDALRFLPMPVTTGIFISALGLGFTMKATFLAVCILIYILPAVTQNVINLQNPANQKDNVYLQTAKTLGMTNWQTFKYVYWPYVMSHTYNEIRQLTAISYTYVTIAECLNKVGGIGAMINICSRQSRIPEVYAMLFLIIIIGLIQDYIIRKMEPVFFPHVKQ